MKKKEFDIDPQLIDWEYWQQNKEKVYEGIDYMKSELVPYCKKNKFYINEDLFRWNSKAKEAKNWEFGLYRNDYGMTVFCHNYGSSIDVFIMLKMKRMFKETTELIMISLHSEYSDDEYTEARKEFLDNALKHIHEGRSVLDGETIPFSYRNMLWNPASVKRDTEKVVLKEYIDTIRETGELRDGWSNALFNVSCDQFYLD